MAGETKFDKIKRIASGSITQRPIPEVPKLPKCLYDRHPEDKEELDAYHAAWVEFFKKSGKRAA